MDRLQRLGNHQAPRLRSPPGASATRSPTSRACRRTSVNGGTIAHGHPIGATGAALPTRLIHGLARDGQGRGLVTCWIGGGQGIAVQVERT